MDGASGSQNPMGTPNPHKPLTRKAARANKKLKALPSVEKRKARMLKRKMENSWLGSPVLAPLSTFTDEMTNARLEQTVDARTSMKGHRERELENGGEAVMRRLPKFIAHQEYGSAVNVLEEAQAIFAEAKATRRLADVTALIERVKGDELAITRGNEALLNREYDAHMGFLRCAREHYKEYSKSEYHRDLKKKPDGQDHGQEAELLGDKARFDVVSEVLQRTKQRAVNDGQQAVQQAWAGLERNEYQLARTFYDGGVKSYGWARENSDSEGLALFEAADEELKKLDKHIADTRDHAAKITKVIAAAQHPCLYITFTNISLGLSIHTD
jgi:hypothetical protein